MPNNKNITKISVLLLTGLIALTYAQADTAWTRRYTSPNAGGSTPSNDYSYGLVVDNDGNVIMTGGSDYLGNAPELLTIKYAPNGDTIWQRVPVRTGSQISRAVVVGATGNVYITGYTMETGNGDYITVKYSPNGTMAWAVLYNGYGTGYDFARKIAIDSAENIYVSGYTQGASSKYFIGTIKYNSSGSQQWVARDSFKGVSSLHYPADLALDYQSNPYVVSRTGPTTASYDYLVAKYNPLTGDTLWVRYYDGTANDQDEARAITFDPDGNVYVTGTSKGAGTGFDIVTLKYDANGTLQWERRFSNPDTADGSDGGWWIAYDPAGYVYVYGHTQGLKATNYYDLVLIKYNALNGNTEWVSYYNGPAGDHYDYPVDKDGQNGMALDQFGNIYVLGLTRQLEGPGTQSTENDFITVKFNSLGDTVWTARYNYADSLETPYAIAVDNYTNVYVTGRSCAPNTYYDAVTIKYTQGALPFYTITANAYGPGTITPSGTVFVDTTGTADTTFYITPDLHAQLDSLVVDGINHGGDSTTYRFEDITSDHTIDAYFSYITYTITATAHDGGTITPSGEVVIIEGEDTTFVITPDIGHHLDSL
ncbi:MAG: SBBP repeat-containing protein, partial [candidate division WOR-3 bacterium]